jgi:hypothetical protein
LRGASSGGGLAIAIAPSRAALGRPGLAIAVVCHKATSRGFGASCPWPRFVYEQVRSLDREGQCPPSGEEEGRDRLRRDTCNAVNAILGGHAGGAAGGVPGSGDERNRIWCLRPVWSVARRMRSIASARVERGQLPEDAVEDIDDVEEPEPEAPPRLPAAGELSEHGPVESRRPGSQLGPRGPRVFICFPRARTARPPALRPGPGPFLDSQILDVERDELAERRSAAANPSSGSARASRCLSARATVRAGRAQSGAAVRTRRSSLIGC